MDKRQYNFSFQVYASISELTEQDAALLTKARAATANAYAPYSHFNVGAAALLNNGHILTGTNQENASYPVGICAERTLMSTVANVYPGAAILTMAISYFNSNGNSATPVAPCGMCRQALTEYQTRTQQPIRLILGGMSGEIFVIENAGQLLPFSFGKNDME
jgi:cytidine deaminase